MMPYFFGNSDEPLFGVYQPPRASISRDAAVLLCSPIGIFYQRTHYALRLLAQHLAEAGLHVLRFDYHGVGDSSGIVEAGEFDRWLDNIELAVNELLDASGATDLTVVGLHSGAVLAIEALLNRKIKTKGLVLWDPVVSGSDYLASLEEIQAQLIALRDWPGTPSQPTDELLGTHFPEDLRARLCGINLAERECMPDVERTALVVSDDRPEYRALLNRMQNRWPDAVYQPINSPVQWDTLGAAFEGRMTGPIIRAVAETTGSLA